MRKFCLIFILFLIGHIAYSQTPVLNALKYENYRSRLLQDFMVGVGPGPGMSIPASVRDTVTGIIQWGDATIDLGYYMGVLATEYHLRKLTGNDTDSTTKELFYALNAFNRLDYTAEIYFGGAPSLNGFFIRDDVTLDSLNTTSVFSHLNQNSTIPSITQISSDLSAANPTLKEMSLDQVIHLLAGLALVIEFIPDTAAYYENNLIQQFHDFETSIKEEAINITIRLVNYIKEGNPIQVNLTPADTNLFGINGINWDFIIRNPVTGLQVARGHNATGLALGYAGAKYRLTGVDSPTQLTTQYQQAVNIFIALENSILPNNQDDKVLLLNALCNCWPGGDYTNNNNFTYNANKIGPRSHDQGYDYIPLLHNVLYQQPNFSLSLVPTTHPYFNNPSGYYTALIDSAPPGGPYNYGNGNYGNWQWSSTSRNIHPERMGDLTPDFPGDYNGLDYMLFYNLQQISNTIVINLNEKEEITYNTLFPNPCSTELVFPLPRNVKSKIEVINLQGKIILLSEVSTGSFNLNCKSLTPGLYIVNITNNKSKEIFKLIIN